MTNKDLTLIAALLDRSGSMSSCKKATESGFDELIGKHRSAPGRALVTLSMFDDEYEKVYSARLIEQVPALELAPRNMTAMLDAVGRFITEVGEGLAALDEADRPGTVICLIMTDGLENASVEWSWEKVKALITHQQDRYNWSFVFLGANIDAVEVGSRMGVPAASNLTYASHDDAAVAASYRLAAREMVNLRDAAASDGLYCVGFSDDDRREAAGDQG